jgi:sortase A
VLGEGNSLLFKVGLIMMSLALLMAAVVVSVALRSEPGRVLPAEVATKSAGDAQRYSSGQQGSATKNSSSHKQSWPYSSGAPVGEGKDEEVKEPQAVLEHQEADPQNSRSETPQPAGEQTPSEASSGSQPQPQKHHQPHHQQQLPGGSEGRQWPKPSQAELQSARGERRYELLPGAIMGLTIEAMGIYDVPVFDSDGQWALANGVAHNPQTSLPWSATPQRNVYLAGHRMGYRGTWSRMIFYNLHKLDTGDEVVLKDRAGRSYRYRVSEVFVTDPKEVWVMGQVRGRDMVTLQTCTPYPTFQKRLIVRADRL